MTNQPRGTLYGRPRRAAGEEPEPVGPIPRTAGPSRRSPPPRPAGPGTTYGSRAYRWLRRRRRMEVVTWGVVTVLASGIVTYAVQTARPSERASVVFLPAPGPATTAGPGCVFGQCQQLEPVGDPSAVRIPVINVESTLEVLGREPSGELTPPSTYDKAGWYGAGIVPGDVGPAVLAGHVDSRSGPAVFYELTRLVAGDRVEVQRGGVWLTFRVTNVERYPKDEFPTERVYGPTPGPELRVITCGGDFDRSRGSYRDNVVVYAVMD